MHVLPAACRRAVALSLPVVVCLLFLVPSTASAQGSSLCSRVASDTGSDNASGSEAQPFRTAQKLVDSLSPGQVGCLRAGTYSQSVRIARGGTSGARVTLRSYPDEKATLLGRLTIVKGADYVTVEELYLDGRNSEGLPSPTVNANDVIFQNNDVTNRHTAICFVLGASNADSSAAYGRALRPHILSNRIHNCGKLPATNHDHGIYIEGTDDAVIAGNWIYDNADRGIQLYPDAQRARITGNVLDGNGTNLIFSGDVGLASSDNSVRGNVMTRPKLRYNVESWWPEGSPKGRDNHVSSNCLHGSTRTDYGTAGINTSDGGFTSTGNLTAAPGYVDAAAKDFRLTASSGCRALLDADASAVPGPGGNPGPAAGRESAPEPSKARRNSSKARSLRIALHFVSAGARARSPQTKVLVIGRMRGHLAKAHTKAKLQVRTDKGWRTRGTAVLREGRLNHRLRPNTKGHLKVRAVARNTISNVVSLRVRPGL